MADKSHDLNDVEDQLRGLDPAPARLDRDRIMYEAGQAAATSQTQSERVSWKWRAAAAMLLLSTIVQSVRLQNVEPQVVEKIVYQDRRVSIGSPEKERPPTILQIASPSTQKPYALRPLTSPDSLIAQRNLLLQSGVEAMTPTTSVPSTGAAILTFGELRNTYLQIGTNGSVFTGNTIPSNRDNPENL